MFKFRGMIVTFCVLNFCSAANMYAKNHLVEALELSALLPVAKENNKSKEKEIDQRAAAIIYQGCFSTVTSWLKAFETLPKNREGADAALHSGFSSCVNQSLWTKLAGIFVKKPDAKDLQWLEFKNVLDAWLQMQKSGPLSQQANWSQANNNKFKPDADFFDTTGACSFAPFAQKLITQPGDSFYLHGDLHGDIFSLLEEIKELMKNGVVDDSFRIMQDNVWLVFLGDYVDRGQYGCEVIYTMMRLALANPDRVIAVRGNHEDIMISSRYGFLAEVDVKFGDVDGSKHRFINRMNDFLPVVFYLGSVDDQGVVNYVQCCHGGIEEEYKPQLFLDDLKTMYQLLGLFSANHSQAAPFDKDIPFGFMWNDFDVDNEKTDYKLAPGRGLKYGKAGTERVLNGLQSSAKSKIRGILRAHQHSGDKNDSMMKGLVQSNGLYKLWKPYEKIPLRKLNDGLVWTFNVGPDSVYGEGVGFNFDTYVKLKIAQAYQNWTMEVFNTKIL